MSEQYLDWAGILAEVKRRGFTLSELARDNGYHHSTFIHVKTKTHYPAQSIIAACIDCEPQQLWPQRYLTKKPRVVCSKYKALLEGKKSNVVTKDMEKAA